LQDNNDIPVDEEVNNGASTSDAVDVEIVEKPKDTTPAQTLSEDIMPLSALVSIDRYLFSRPSSQEMRHL